MKDKPSILLLLMLLGCTLSAVIWWGLFTQTPLLLLFFQSPEHYNGVDSLLDLQNKMMALIALWGGLALLLPVLSVVSGHLYHRRQMERSTRKESRALTLAYSFAILSSVLLLCTFCGTWSLGLFYSN